mgnify:CR=1 FL=1
MEELLDNDLNALNGNAPVITKDKGIFNFTHLTQDELAAKVENFLKTKGYKLEEGAANNGKYGKGSRVLRILFGAFVKRFAWKITVDPNGQLTQLIIGKEAKGYVGGAIGVHQVNKEFKSIVGSLTQFHVNQESEKR